MGHHILILPLEVPLLKFSYEWLVGLGWAAVTSCWNLEGFYFNHFFARKRPYTQQCPRFLRNLLWIYRYHQSSKLRPVNMIGLYVLAFTLSAGIQRTNEILSQKDGFTDTFDDETQILTWVFSSLAMPWSGGKVVLELRPSFVYFVKASVAPRFAYYFFYVILRLVN